MQNVFPFCLRRDLPDLRATELVVTINMEILHIKFLKANREASEVLSKLTLGLDGTFENQVGKVAGYEIGEQEEHGAGGGVAAELLLLVIEPSQSVHCFVLSLFFRVCSISFKKGGRIGLMRTLMNETSDAEEAKRQSQKTP